MPVTTLPISLTVAALCGALPMSSTAVSREAVVGLEQMAVEQRKISEALGKAGPRACCLRMLEDIADECRFPDWDSYGAVPVTVLVLEKTRQFISRLPVWVSSPELSAEPDGSIGLEWSPDSTRSFSLSISNSQRIHYAWLDGTDRGHAVERDPGHQLPPRLMQSLAQLLRHATPVRTA